MTFLLPLSLPTCNKPLTFSSARKEFTSPFSAGTLSLFAANRRSLPDAVSAPVPFKAGLPNVGSCPMMRLMKLALAGGNGVGT